MLQTDFERLFKINLYWRNAVIIESTGFKPPYVPTYIENK